MSQSTAVEAKKVNGVGTWEGPFLSETSRLARSRSGLVGYNIIAS